MRRRCVIGLDAGGTKLLGGVVDEELVVHNRVHRVWHGTERTEVLDTMVEAVEEARAAAPDAEAVGFGIPSLIEWPAGRSVVSVHLPLDGIPFREMLAERLGLPVFVDNDANSALLAEHRHGAARGTSDAVLLTIGTGIGGALVLGGRLYRGSSGAAAELGHMVVDMDGPPCQGGCPNRGCLEAVASGSALGREGERLAREWPDSALGRAEAAGRPVTGALVTELAHDGDPAALEALELIGTRLGVGLSSIVNVFDPEVIVIGGGVIAAGELLLAPAREELARRALDPGRARVVGAAFGEEAGMLGAAVLALERGEAEP